MERLTTDNPRNNTEMALNLVYVKDGQAWVRNGGPCPGYPDVTLYDYMRLIIADHGPMSIKTGLTDDELGDALDDALFDGIETKEGLCAMLYTLAWAFAELRQRLAAYEDTGLTPEGMEAIKTSLMGKSLAEWVNAEERLPESPGRYLTVSAVPKYGVKVIDVLRFAGAWIWGGSLDIIVTHWMPLPEPPKEGK